MQDLFYFAYLLVHDLVGIFAGGRSDIKIYLFFAFTILVVILAFSGLKFIHKIKLSGKTIITTIAITFIYNLALLVGFFCKFGFKISDFVVVFHNNEVSSTTLLHNHVGKGFNGLLLQLFGNGQQENIDTGLAFVGLMPTPLLWVSGVLMLVCAVMLIIRFLQNLQLNPKWKALQIIIFSVLGFSLLKNMLDGGILNREAPVALAGLLIADVISRHNLNEKRLLIKIAISIVPTYIVLSLLLVWAKIIDLNFWLGSVFLIATFCTITTTLLYWLWQKQITRLGILLGILMLTFLYVPVNGAVNIFNNSKTKVSDSGAYVGLYANPQGPGQWNKLDSINKLTLYHYIPQSSDETAVRLLKNNNLLGNLNPVTLPWQFCVPTSKPGIINFNFSTASSMEPQKTAHEFIQLTNVQLIDQHKNLKTYAISVDLNECAPRALNQIEEVFKEQGFDSFFISNVRSEDNSLYGRVE